MTERPRPIAPARPSPRTRRCLRLAATVAAAVAIVALAPAHAAATAAPTAAAQPAWLQTYVAEPRLAGEGRLTWYGLHIYDARLWVPAGAAFDAAAPAAPFALELVYARALAGKAIAERSRDEIARLGFGSDGQRAAWLQQMLAVFPDVRAHQHLAGVFVPQRGVRFYLDGRALGSIDDPEFAHAFFAIWLDARTSVPKLRTGLLRRAAP